MKEEYRDPWERHYASGASIWRGSPHPIPDAEYGKRFLDIGCGTGSTLIRACEKGYDTTGIDISPTALRITEDRLDSRGLRARLLEMDISEKGIPGKFDLVCVHYVMGSMTKKSRKSSRDNILKAMGRGCLLSFEDLAQGDMRQGKGSIIESNTVRKGDGIVQHFFDEDEVSSLFGELRQLGSATETWEHGGMKRARVRSLFQSDPGLTSGS